MKTCKHGWSKDTQCRFDTGACPQCYSEAEAELADFRCGKRYVGGPTEYRTPTNVAADMVSALAVALHDTDDIPGVRRVGAWDWTKDISNLREARRAAAQELLTALWLYPGHRLDSRGPYGCILRALDILDPKAAQAIRDGQDPSELVDDEESV